MNCLVTDQRGLSDAALSYMLDRIGEDSMISHLYTSPDSDDALALVVARVFAIALGAGVVLPPPRSIAAGRVLPFRKEKKP